MFLIYKAGREIIEMVHRLETSEGTGQLGESSYMNENQGYKSPE